MRTTFQSRVGILSLLLVTACGGSTAPQRAKGAAESERTADVVYVATPHDVVARMLDVAGVGKNDVLYDLGCGDGRIVVTAVRKCGCRGFGFDINPRRVEESQRNARRRNVERLATIEERDIFELDLSPASVVTLYLLPELNVKLIPQLDKLKPGSRIVSHDFDMEGVKPDKVINMTSKEDGVEHEIFLWTTPLKKSP
jgi:SAM-dependent methyltransferase